MATRLGLVLVALATMVLIAAGGSWAGAGAGPAAKTVVLKADDGVVASSGKVVKDGSALKVDIVAYKHGTGLDLKGGRKDNSHMALHKFKKKDKYASAKSVPCVAPLDSEKNAYLSLPEVGRGFTVKGNKSPGYYRAVVKKVEAGAVTIEFMLCP